MLLNSYIAWNLATSTGHRSDKRPLLKYQFYAALAEEMLAFTENDSLVDYAEELCLPIVENDDDIEVDRSYVNDYSHKPSYSWSTD